MYQGNGYRNFRGNMYQNYRGSNRNNGSRNRGSQNRGSQNRGSQNNSNNMYTSPAYTADVQNGFVQSVRGTYFTGVADPIVTANSAYFLICNPCNSGVNVYLNKVSVTNLASTPVQLSEYLCGYPSGTLTGSCNISNTNMDYCQRNSCARIASSDSLMITTATLSNTTLIPATTTSTDTLGGSIILTPGSCYIAQVSSPTGAEVNATASFSWWEEPTNC